MTTGNLHIEWARLLVGTLAQAGIDRVILSPGARSTPLVVGALRTAGLPIVDVLDERSAAFVALGCARATGRASLLVCTSGTAAAHYLPAIIEARYARLPLVVLTADRPPELQDRAAPQTIDQRRLYGQHVLESIDLGLPDGDRHALAGLRYTALRAATTALGPLAGPVHLNAAFRKPLEPQPAAAGDIELTRRVDALLAAPLPAVASAVLTPSHAALEPVLDACQRRPRGLIVAGPAVASQRALRTEVEKLSAATGFPLLVEAASQLGASAGTPVVRCGSFDAILHSGLAETFGPPELVLQLGAPPMSAAWARYMEKHAGRFVHVVLATDGLRDPTNGAHTFVGGDVSASVRRLVEGLRSRGGVAPTSGAWVDAWRAAQGEFDRLLRERIDGAPASDFVQGRAVREVLRSVPAHGVFMVGNSLAIRLVDAFGADLLPDVDVLSQRGASGIDGLISGAVGAALATERPVTLLLGDVAFLHDLQGLEVARRLTTPLVVVVLNNDGGRIFEQLPMASAPELRPELERHWVMSHGLSMHAAAELFGHSYVAVSDPRELGAHLAEAQRHAGCTVVEVRVTPELVPELWRLWSTVRS